MSEYNGEQAPPTIDVPEWLSDEALEREYESHELVQVVGPPDRNPYEPEPQVPTNEPTAAIVVGVFGVVAAVTTWAVHIQRRR